MVRSLVLLLLGAAALATDAAVVNSNVKRVIDLTRHIVRVHTDIAFSDADAATDKYAFALPKRQSARLAHVTAKCGKKAAICEVVRVDTEESALVDQYAVVMQHAVPAGEPGHIKLTAYYTRVLTPFPTEVTQTDDQLVLYEDAHVFTSPYRTETQTTKVKLPSGRIESYSQVAPTTHKGASITYGPYTDVAPFVAPDKTIRIHFKNHSPFLTVTTLVKEIEVSMWGRVSFEEVYDLLHTGATLTGGFSRFDYSVKGARGASFHELRANLPRDAVNVYYRDQIGNVSTSRLRPTATRQELEFKPRFPIFGGWKSQWYLGYSVPTHSVLSRTGDNKFKLEVDFSTSLEGAAVDDLTVKVILPEGATNVEANLPFEVDAQSRTTRQTYLDTPVFGRPVLVLQKKNVVAQHNVPFEVTFEFQTSFMLHEPLLLVGAFLALFLFCMLVFRLDVSLVKTTAPNAKKPKTE